MPSNPQHQTRICIQCLANGAASLGVQASLAKRGRLARPLPMPRIQANTRNRTSEASARPGRPVQPQSCNTAHLPSLLSLRTRLKSCCTACHSFTASLSFRNGWRGRNARSSARAGMLGLGLLEHRLGRSLGDSGICEPAPCRNVSGLPAELL